MAPCKRDYCKITQCTCPECNGVGNILRSRPKNAIGTYGKDLWEYYADPCWRCKGSGKLKYD